MAAGKEVRGALPEAVREDLAALAVRYGVRRIRLFGSRARGDHQAKSDIDLAIYGCRDFRDLSGTGWIFMKKLENFSSNLRVLSQASQQRYFHEMYGKP